MSRWQYPALAEPFPEMELVTLDKWLSPSPLSPPRRSPDESGGGFLLQEPTLFVAPPELSWQPCLVMAIWPLPRPVTIGAFLAEPSDLPANEGEIFLDKWWQPLQVPVLPPLPRQGGLWGFLVEPTTYEVPLVSSWLPGLFARQQARRPSPPPPGSPFLPDLSTVYLTQRLTVRASQHTTFALQANRATTVRVPARTWVTFQLRAQVNMSVTSNLTWFRGEDIVLDFIMTPVEDITGWAISFKVSDTVGGTVQFTKTASIVDGPRGKFRVTIASADTASLSAGRYVWDARRTDSGYKATLADGFIDLKREVTA